MKRRGSVKNDGLVLARCHIGPQSRINPGQILCFQKSHERVH